LLTLQFCCALLLIGCEKDKSGKATPAPASTQPVRTGTATIHGTVTLSGRAPVMPTLPNKPCHEGAEPLKDESVVADESGHLQNVVVYLEDAPPAPPASDLPAVVLDQKNCQYIPHVLALRTGQTLHVTTSDPVIHNVHGLCAVNEPFNFALIRAGQSKDLTFAQPEPFPVRCDVHPWMKAYVHVFVHPYFAVTGRDGTFEIHNVPAGTYMLVAWQENYGTLKQKVSTSDHQTASADFVFQSGH
jgi:plastocyanin